MLVEKLGSFFDGNDIFHCMGEYSTAEKIMGLLRAREGEVRGVAQRFAGCRDLEAFPTVVMRTVILGCRPRIRDGLITGSRKGNRLG